MRPRLLMVSQVDCDREKDETYLHSAQDGTVE